MFRLLTAIFSLIVKQRIHYGAIKWTMSRLRKVLQYWKGIIKVKYELW